MTIYQNAVDKSQIKSAVQCDLVLGLRDVGGVPAHSVAEHVHLLDLVHGVTLHTLTV